MPNVFPAHNQGGAKADGPGTDTITITKDNLACLLRSCKVDDNLRRLYINTEINTDGMAADGRVNIHTDATMSIDGGTPDTWWYDENTYYFTKSGTRSHVRFYLQWDWSELPGTSADWSFTFTLSGGAVWHSFFGIQAGS